MTTWTIAAMRDSGSDLIMSAANADDLEAAKAALSSIPGVVRLRIIEQTVTEIDV